MAVSIWLIRSPSVGGKGGGTENPWHGGGRRMRALEWGRTWGAYRASAIRAEGGRGSTQNPCCGEKWGVHKAPAMRVGRMEENDMGEGRDTEPLA